MTGNYRDVRTFYSDDRAWLRPDFWHWLVTKRTQALLRSVVHGMPALPSLVANVGSGGVPFGVSSLLHLHIDLVEGRLLNTIGVVANAEALPVRDNCVDLTICVGSVINHGNAAAMIREMARISKSGALLVLEFDCADGLHQRTQSGQNDSVPTSTFFNGRMLQLVEYSRAHVERALACNDMQIVRRHSFHIASAWLLKLGVPPRLAAGLVAFDAVMRLLPSTRLRGSNLVLVARKK